MTASDFSKAFDPFLPKNASSLIFDYVKDEKLKFKITRERKTKFGDFRADPKAIFQTITINGNLNKSSFLITLVHEIAHLKVYRKYIRKGQPHGPKWKKIFQELMAPFLTQDFFPEEVLIPLVKHMQNPKASSGSDPKLYKALMNQNTGEVATRVEDLKEGEKFIFREKTYQKGIKRRTRYLCYLLPSKRPFLFNGLAEVEVIKS